MIPAKITSLNPPQVTWYGLPEPDASKYHDNDLTLYGIAYGRYLDSQFIADVENAENWENFEFASFDGTQLCQRKLSLNQPVFIELTGEGKCKIIKL